VVQKWTKCLKLCDKGLSLNYVRTFPIFWPPLPPSSFLFCHTLTNPLGKEVPFHLPLCYHSQLSNKTPSLGTKNAQTFLHVLVDVPLAYTTPPPAVTHSFISLPPPLTVDVVYGRTLNKIQQVVSKYVSLNPLTAATLADGDATHSWLWHG
jgi:hypothetical protein